MTAILVLNTTSLRELSTPELHSQFLNTLVDTFLAVQSALPTWSRGLDKIKMCLPEDLYSQAFGSEKGPTLLHALSKNLTKPKHILALKLFTKSQLTFDLDGIVEPSDCDQECWSAGREALWKEGAGLDPPLTATLHLGTTPDTEHQVGSALWSADATGWQTTPVRVSVMQLGVKMAPQDVANFWTPTLQTEHKLWLGKCALDVLPAYENQGQHEPDFLNNRQNAYDSNKSIIPIGAEKLLASARRSKHGHWWAYCECKAFHRFQGTTRSGLPLVHWNGTTHRNAKQVTAISEVPAELQKLLKADPLVNDCGCRS